MNISFVVILIVQIVVNFNVKVQELLLVNQYIMKDNNFGHYSWQRPTIRYFDLFHFTYILT